MRCSVLGVVLLVVFSVVFVGCAPGDGPVAGAVSTLAAPNATHPLQGMCQLLPRSPSHGMLYQMQHLTPLKF